MSKQYENDVAKAIWYADPSYVRSYTAGYSGNNAFPQPDVLVHDNGTGLAHALELKGPIKGDQVSIEEDDVRQMEACRGPMTRSWLVIKFQNRRPLVFPYVDEVGKDDTEPMEKLLRVIEEMAPFTNPRVPGEYLYVDKPDLEDFFSARASDDDHVEILKGLGIYQE